MELDRDTAHRRYVNAAIALAATVSADDRIRTEPSYPADRSRHADRLRAESFVEILAEYRAAAADFDAAWAAA